MNSIYASQIGFTQTGSAYGSTLTIGRTVSGTFEGIGFGQQGRPDYAGVVAINLTQAVGDGTLNQMGTITLNVGDILAQMALRSQFPGNLNLVLKEVLVCESNVTKAMMIIGSQTYPTGSA